MREYVAPPTVGRFMQSDAAVRFLMGPYGSGKSVGSAVELVRRAFNHPPRPDGVRPSQFLIVRNTYRQLKDTTLKTFLEWFPEGAPGRLLKSDMVYEIKTPLDDGTRVESYFLFRPFDSEQDQSNALSLELTGAWVNEFREILPTHIINILGRCGRYKNGRDPRAWTGVVADSNHPNEGGAYHKMFEGETIPDDYRDPTGRRIFEVFRQPGGLSPHAENVEHLSKGYYERMVQMAALDGKDEQWVNVHVHSMYGRINDGQPVYRGFWNERIHVSPTVLEPDPKRVIGVGYDPGLGAAAAVLGQMDSERRWRIFAEINLKNAVTADMLREVQRLLHERYGLSRPQTVWFCDPYTKSRSGTDRNSPLHVLRAKGVKAIVSLKNIEPRISGMRTAMSGLAGGVPRLLVDASCRAFIEGANGGYAFRKMQTRDEKFTPEPDKNFYSNVHDAAQYLISPFEVIHERDGRRRWPEMHEMLDDDMSITAGDPHTVHDFNPHKLFRR